MRKVEASINIDRPTAIVFDAFIEPSQLRKWWELSDAWLNQNKEASIL